MDDYTVSMHVLRRVPNPSVALETTLLLHGVPSQNAMGLHRELCAICRDNGAHPALIGLIDGQPIAGITEQELEELLARDSVPKANTSNLGVLKYWGASAATTVSATMEIAAASGISVFATGGLGGIHQNLWSGGPNCNLDVSSDLAAMSRYPVAVVSSGVKSILDVVATREALESLGVCVIGYQTDRFPAFYSRTSEAGVDARFNDPQALSDFVQQELARTNRGILIVNPIPKHDEIDEQVFAGWLDMASAEAEESGAVGRAVTPVILGTLHRISNGRTLEANLALVRSNTALASQLSGLMHSTRKHHT
jgi:pseudouridylate synthase